MSLTPPRELPVGWEDAIPAQAGTASGLLIYLPALLAALCVVPFWLQRSKASAPESDAAVAPAESSSSSPRAAPTSWCSCRGRTRASRALRRVGLRVARLRPTEPAPLSSVTDAEADVLCVTAPAEALVRVVGAGAAASLSSLRRQAIALELLRAGSVEAAGAAAFAEASGSYQMVPAPDPDAGVDLERLVAEGAVLDYLAVHAEGERAALGARWLRRAFLSAPPLVEIAGYLGEKVALYFAWLDFYTWLLALLTVASAPVLLARAAFGPDNLLMPLYSLALVVATACFLQLWRRRIASLGTQWPRPRLPRREERPLHTWWDDTGRKWRKVRDAGRKALTTQTTVALGLCVIIAASQLLLLKGRLSKDLGRFGLGLGAALHGTFIGVTNLFYSHLARHLTRWENPRTQARRHRAFSPRISHTLVSHTPHHLHHRAGGVRVGAHHEDDALQRLQLVHLAHVHRVRQGALDLRRGQMQVWRRLHARTRARGARHLWRPAAPRPRT